MRTSDIFFVSGGNTGVQEETQNSETYVTVGGTRALNKRLIMGQDFLRTSHFKAAREWGQLLKCI